MSEKPVTDRINAIIADQLGIEISEVTPEARLKQDLGADSIDMVELFVALEEEFNQDIPDKDASKMKTVGEVIDYFGRVIES
jgi:acyl carrier protein